VAWASSGGSAQLKGALSYADVWLFGVEADGKKKLLFQDKTDAGGSARWD